MPVFIGQFSFILIFQVFFFSIIDSSSHIIDTRPYRCMQHHQYVSVFDGFNVEIKTFLRE